METGPTGRISVGSYLITREDAFWETRTLERSVSRRYGELFGHQVWFGWKGECTEFGRRKRKRMRISVPHFDNSAIIKSYSRTLVARGLNPEEQEIPAMVTMLPKIWKLENKVLGVEVGNDKVQYDFQSEDDIEAVLKQQPYHFDGCMVSLARWQPKMSLDFPSEITFWIKVLGISTEFWAEQTFCSIGDAIGETLEVDLDYGRIRVVIDVTRELILETVMDFTAGEYHDGDEAIITLRYEKLIGYCTLCNRLMHIMERCPLNPNRVAKKEKKKDNRDDCQGRKEDRSRSYKGIVIHGNGSSQEKEKDRRDYVGKGKGKVVEVQGSKWDKTGGKEGKRSYYQKGQQRFDEETSRGGNQRREGQRNMQSDAEERKSRRTRRDKSPLGKGKEGEREEGEIKDPTPKEKLEVRAEDQPSLEFQLALLNTQADPVKDTQVDTAQNWAQEVEEYKEEGMDVDGGVGLEVSLGLGINDENSGLLLSESELADFEENNGDEMTKKESGTGTDVNQDVSLPLADKSKRQGVRKGSTKPPAGADGSNKMRLAQGLASPRRRVAGKTGLPADRARKHDDMKMEMKGSSDSTTDHKTS